jgi:ribosomal protein L5
VLRLIEEDINWQNIPKITEVTVHSMIKGATEDSAYLHVAGLMLQSITGARPEVHRAAHTVAQFGIRKEMPISLTCTLKGEEAWQFIDKCVNLVLPKIKDWPGVKGTTGDSSGNLAFGIDKWSAQLFPEVEVNYDVSCCSASHRCPPANHSLDVSSPYDSRFSCHLQDNGNVRSPCKVVTEVVGPPFLWQIRRLGCNVVIV